MRRGTKHEQGGKFRTPDNPSWNAYSRWRSRESQVSSSTFVARTSDQSSMIRLPGSSHPAPLPDEPHLLGELRLNREPPNIDRHFSRVEPLARKMMDGHPIVGLVLPSTPISGHGLNSALVTPNSSRVGSVANPIKQEVEKLTGRQLSFRSSPQRCRSAVDLRFRHRRRREKDEVDGPSTFTTLDPSEPVAWEAPIYKENDRPIETDTRVSGVRDSNAIRDLRMDEEIVIRKAHREVTK